NLHDPLFTSNAVREALTRAVDREAIVRGLCYGFAELFEGPITPIGWAYEARPLTPYDPKGAARLLAKEGGRDTDGDGWLDRDGKRFEFDLLVATGNDLRKSVTVPLQANWKAIGVKANIVFKDNELCRTLRENHNFQATISGWQANAAADLTNV